MKNILKFLAIGIILAASSSRAHASPLTGSLTIDGGMGALAPSVLNSSTTSLGQTGVIIALGGAGSLASVPLFEFVAFSSNFTFSVGGPSLLGEQLLAFVNNGIAEVFGVDNVVLGANGSLIFYGTLTDGNVADSAPAFYILTPNASGDGSFSGTLNVPHAPEPDSIYLAGLLTLKRRQATQL